MLNLNLERWRTRRRRLERGGWRRWHGRPLFRRRVEKLIRFGRIRHG